MRKNKTILAGEDSGGLSIGEHIPEKDGLLANLLILEMMASENKSLKQLVKEIKEFASCEFYTDRVDIKLNDEKEADSLIEKYSKLNKIGDFEIKEILTIDGVKLFLNNKLTTLLIRKSGTEPLLRFYIESEKIENIEKIKTILKD